MQIIDLQGEEAIVAAFTQHVERARDVDQPSSKRHARPEAEITRVAAERCNVLEVNRPRIRGKLLNHVHGIFKHPQVDGRIETDPQGWMINGGDEFFQLVG